MKEDNAKARLLYLRKLKELINEYSRRGYEVFADYLDYQRPRIIGDLKPDLIAKKGDREIIIEIASRSEMDKIKSKLEKFAEYADKSKDVRFDIVLTNPRPSFTKNTKSSSQRRLLKHIWRYLMRDVNVAYGRKQYAAAFYLLYDLLKSMLEEVATDKGILPASGMHTLRQINDALHECGLLEKEDYNSVRNLIIARNLQVHKTGYEIDKNHLERAKEMANALVKNLDKK